MRTIIAVSIALLCLVAVSGSEAIQKPSGGACSGPACRAEVAVETHVLNRYGFEAEAACRHLRGSLYRCRYSGWGRRETLCRGSARVRLRLYLNARLGKPHGALGNEDWNCR